MKVKICPKCGSTDINFTNTYEAPPSDVCRSCGFGSTTFEGFNQFPEVEESEVKLIQEDLKEFKKTN